MKVFYKHYRVPSYVTGLRGQPENKHLFGYSRAKKRKSFTPASTGGATECTIALDNGAVFKGVAFCSYSDPFCYKTGREIAYERAVNAALETGEQGFVASKNEYVMRIPKSAAPYIAAGLKSLMSDKHYTSEYRARLGEALKDVQVAKFQDDA